MHLQLWEVPHDIRVGVSAAIKDRKFVLAEGIASAAADVSGLNRELWRDCAGVLVAHFATAIRSGELEAHGSMVRALERYTTSLPTRQIVRAIHAAECILLETLSLDRSLGSGSKKWPLVAHAIRSAAFEIAATYAGRDDRPPKGSPPPTLLPPDVFRIALGQEVARAHRHEHGLSVLLFDVDTTTAASIDGADDHLTGRVGALARRFFRSHDWIARHGDCSIAALLPQTPLDDAAELGIGFCDMVGQRLVLADFQTGAETRATISAAVAGADSVQENCDPEFIMAALESAVIRARLDGGNRFERVVLEEIWRSGKGGTVNCEL
jgi:GGDEF domain-containing protein